MPDLDPRDESVDPLAELLTASRPAPDAGWSRATERGIVATVRRRRAERRAAYGAGLGLALTLLGVSLAGGGPLAIDGGDAAKADQDCRTVYETKVESAGEVIERTDGRVVVRSTEKPVQREVTRCR